MSRRSGRGYLLVLALASGACGSPDNPVPTDPRDPSPDESPSSGVVSTDGIATMNAYTGIPFGPQGLWGGPNGPQWGPEPFTGSSNSTAPSGIVAQINAARTINQKLILNMTGGDHEKYKTDGKFDLAKWKATMNTFNTTGIKAAVAAGVADGTIVMNNVMDEPNITDWGGVMTKPLLDEMATYVRGFFPTLPVGVTHRPSWRTYESYRVMDAIFVQYSWRKGEAPAFRDTALTTGTRDGVSIVFSLNVLNGGIADPKTDLCPIPLTGGDGTRAGLCRMTADQVRDWGRLFGVRGCAMSLWRYDDAFMANPANQQAFRDVAATLATVPGRPCRRVGGSTPPPANTPPTAAFTAPSCTVGVACQFTDGSSDNVGIATRRWDFGGGATSTQTNPTHTFIAAGSHSVTLTVTDGAGESDAVTRSVTSSAANSPPTAAFDAPSCTVGVACQFTDGSSDDVGIATRSWDFGGATSTQTNPTHTFATAGSHSVTLTVTDAAGESNAVTKSVTAGSPANTPPTAAFDAPSCRAEATCLFNDVSNDGDGSIASRLWEFGNGDTSTEANPSITYATAGVYSVTLTVTDNDDAVSAITKSVTIRSPTNSPPTAAFDAPSCTSGVACQFNDGSSDDDGTIATRRWEFGNGETSPGANPSPTYAASGDYSVTLTVTDNDNAESSITKSVTVGSPANAPPTAAFTAPSCTVGVACQFTDGSSDDVGIATHNWDFGGGATSGQANPTHTFATAGSHSVTLTVTDAAGETDAVTRSVTASAGNSPPTAAFNAPSCTVGVACQFTDGSSDDVGIATRSWDFGGGATSALTNPTHTFTTAGSRNVTLTVTDAAGESDAVTRSVTAALASTPNPITLSLTGSVKSGRQHVMLNWSGAVGSSVGLYRDGGLLQTTANDGSQNDVLPTQGKASYIYKVCETSGSRCSAPVTFVLPSILLNVTAWMKEVDLQAMTYLWIGASGATVNLYRNGALIKNTSNTGRYTITRRFQGAATYLLKVCETATSKCSNTVTATFP